jgi:uncharacterized membrane protein
MLLCAGGAGYFGWLYYNANNAGPGAIILTVLVIWLFIRWNDKIDRKAVFDQAWEDASRRARSYRDAKRRGQF